MHWTLPKILIWSHIISHVVCIIEGKLPHSLEMEWYRHIHKGRSPVDKLDKFPYLLEFLKVERAALEYGTPEMQRQLRQGNVNSLDSSQSNPRMPSQIGGQETGEHLTRKSVINIVDSLSGLCLLHGTGNHDTKDCRKYGKMNVSDRYALLRSSSACFGCSKPNHQMSNCDRRVACGDGCEKFHHKFTWKPEFRGSSRHQQLHATR